MNSQNIYKSEYTNIINMIPGNLKGLPDESFFLNFWRHLWKKL